MKKTSKVKNPIAKVVRTLKPRIVAAKKAKVPTKEEVNTLRRKINV